MFLSRRRKESGRGVRKQFDDKGLAYDKGCADDNGCNDDDNGIEDCVLLGDDKNRSDEKYLQPYKDDANSGLAKKKASGTGRQLLKRIHGVLRRLCCIQKIKD